MYNTIEGGTILNIQGLQCSIPPVGYVYNSSEDKLEYIGVYSRSKIKEDQFWERTPLPSWYKETLKRWDEYDKKKKEGDPDFYDDKLNEYQKIEWHRRLHGYWFMNNGEPVYLTGSHYMFMQWWQIDVGYPRFRYPDLDYFYFLQYCIEDPECFGMLEITKRRFGKTFRGGLFLYEYITRTKMTNGAIQSKSGGDGKKVFAKAVINPFKKLPRFFRPEYDMSLGITPKTEIRFQQTNIRGRKAEENLFKEELGSVIDFGSADPIYYDGSKIHRGFHDEWAKTIECNIYDRWDVFKYCLLNDDGRIIGKALFSSTVEKLETDREGVQEAAKLLWDDSDQLNKRENGRTASGLYRFFMTADRGRNIDIYGTPNQEKTVKEILADRAAVVHNPRALSNLIKKEARTIEEAFNDDGEKCIFNIHNILEREKQLAETPIFKRQVLFWRDGTTQKVHWRDIRKGEEDFCWRITQFPPQGEDNKYKIEDGKRKPNRIKDGAISVDSYSNSQGGRKYGSKASAWIGRRYNNSDPEGTKKAIGHLYGRPNEKDILHEQVLLAAEYYGYKVWFEHNSDSYDTYFRDRGKRGYLGLYPMNCIDPTKKETTERHRGVPTTPFSLTTQHDIGIAYFENDIHRIDFEELLKPAKKFDPYDRTAYDAVVSFLILLVVLHEQEKELPPPQSPLIKTYPNTLVSYGA